MAAGEMIQINSRIAIPLDEIEIHFVRAGGPGGQNVNKVSSKAVLRFDLRGSPSLPETARRRALQRLQSKLTRSGEIVLSASRHRDQRRNRDEAVERLRELLAEAVTPPKRRIPTAPSVRARERRLTEKKARARLKRERQSLD
jgi:ribosome-associated protein